MVKRYFGRCYNRLWGNYAFCPKCGDRLIIRSYKKRIRGSLKDYLNAGKAVGRSVRKKAIGR